MGKSPVTLIAFTGVILLALSTYLAWVPGGEEREERIRGLLRESAKEGPGGSLQRAMRHAVAHAAPVGEADTPESGPKPIDRAKIEAEIDELPLAPFERPIAAAFGHSSEGALLRRIVLARRYEGYVDGSARLEDIYIEELARDAESALRVIADALKELPKSEYREEHVLLRDLSNRLPEGYLRLQELVPDEEFQ